MRVVNKILDFDKDEILSLKLGGIDDPIERVYTYNTTTENRIHILKFCEVDDWKLIEKCVQKLLLKYQIKYNKEYYKCSYNDIIIAITKCIKLLENRVIDKTPDTNQYNSKLNRLLFKFSDFDPNKIYKVYLIDDESKNELADEINKELKIIQMTKPIEYMQDGGYFDKEHAYLHLKILYLTIKRNILMYKH
jgi:hypothetical protein